MPRFLYHPLQNTTELELDILAPPVRMGGLGFTNPRQEETTEYAESIRITAPLSSGGRNYIADARIAGD